VGAEETITVDAAGVSMFFDFQIICVGAPLGGVGAEETVTVDAPRVRTMMRFI